MSVKYIVNKVLQEQIQVNKKVLDRLYTKWKETYPSLTLDDAEKIYVFHAARKQNFKPNQPEVAAFLARHDGLHGSKKYELKNLLDIQQVDIKALLSLLNDFGGLNITSVQDTHEPLNVNEREMKEIFSEDGVLPTQRKIEVSKQMWYDESTAVVNEPNFRVYSILNQTHSIRMGYYYQEIHRKNYIERKTNGLVDINAPWCVTHRKGIKVFERGFGYEQGNNMYITYRKPDNYNDNTFYFVIDEDREQTDKYYMSALAIKGNGNYLFTSMFNNDGNILNWQQVLAIYPKLENHKDAIKYRRLTEKEEEGSTKSIVDVINETEGSPNNYQRQETEVKRQYVLGGGVLSQPRSWEVSTPDIRQSYVSTLTRDTVNAKFNNLDFLTAVLETPGYTQKLTHKLSQFNINKGISFLIDHLIKGNYDPYRRNVLNKNITLYENKTTGTYCLFDSTRGRFLKIGGITYDDGYKPDNDIYSDENGKTYLVEIYSKSNVPDEKSFYCMTNIVNDNETDCYIFTHSKWLSLLENEGLSNIPDRPDLNPEDEADVRETIKQI